MDFEQAIRILKEAQGDPARLGLASVDLLLAGDPDEEREKVRTALEVAAVPHWFDEKILAALLDPPLHADAEALAARLRRLPVVEPFPARGPGVANVQEATRVALRARMKAESPERLRALSTGARACFAGDAAPHARIEALYHRFTAEPKAAARECGALAEEWEGAGRYEALLGLGVMLHQLLQEGLPEGIVRGAALYWLARIRFDYQPLGITAGQAYAAAEEYRRSGDDWRIAMDLLNNVMPLIPRGPPFILRSADSWPKRLRRIACFVGLHDFGVVEMTSSDAIEIENLQCWRCGRTATRRTSLEKTRR